VVGDNDFVGIYENIKDCMGVFLDVILYCCGELDNEYPSLDMSVIS
jgi:hypothetical protein